MLSHLFNSIESAIESYENLFSPVKPMSLRRAQDIIELRDLLKPTHYTNARTAIESIQNRLEQMKTGWWIFRTGRSKLKQNIADILDYFSNELMGALFESVQEIYDLIEQKPLRIENPKVHYNEVARLSAEIELLTVANSELQQRIYKLEIENAAFKRDKSNNLTNPFQAMSAEQVDEDDTAGFSPKTW